MLSDNTLSKETWNNDQGSYAGKKCIKDMKINKNMYKSVLKMGKSVLKIEIKTVGIPTV